tara:strand:+ start:193 stop:708 length:516 start_codon:yes stop_codon:yes gene_type:complete
MKTTKSGIISDPSKWGPCVWKGIHTLLFALPRGELSPKEKLATYEFLTSLKYLLPCVDCQQHYTQYIDQSIQSPESQWLKTGDSICKWAVDLHNHLNRQNGKPEFKYESVANVYLGTSDCKSKHCSKEVSLLMNDNCYGSQNTVLIIIMVLLLSYVLLFGYFRTRVTANTS